jgi:predicted permease
MSQDPRGARWIYRLRLRLRTLFRPRHVEQELSEEVTYHLERLTEQNMAAGMSQREARQAAARAFGGVTQRVEECRDTRRMRVVEDLVQDTRYAVRTVIRAPVFAATATLTLTLGIGATVAVFTVFSGVLLRPLPFPEADRLYLIAHSPRGPFFRQPSLADREYLAFRASDRAFEATAAFATYDANLIAGSEPARISVGRVTGEFFTTLRVPAAAGRTFGPEDGETADQLIILSDEIWRGKLGADAGIIGRTVTLDGRPRTVIGIMPPHFGLPQNAQAWTMYSIELNPRQSMMTPVVGRLKPGVSADEARAQFGGIAAQFREKAGPAWSSGLVPLKELLVGDVRRPLEIFAAAVLFILLIACANVANLLLARASARQREMAVRMALGASRGRLIRQLLTENLFVSSSGGVCGLVVAAWGVPALLALAPDGRIPRLESIAIDLPVAAFALAVSLATGLVFGLAPAFRLTRRAGSASLVSRMPAGAPGQERLRSALVVAEIALALVLLTGAGLLAQSVLRLRAVAAGFEASNVLTVTVDLPLAAYSSIEELHAFHRALLDRLAQLPGVVRAGAVNWRPLGSMLISGDFTLEGIADADQLNVDKPAVSPGYFQAMGIRLLYGRDFSPADSGTSAGVAIVSRTVARMADPSGNAVGKRVAMSTDPKPGDWLTIVGVVDDVRQLGPAQPPHAAIYRPYQQVTQPFFLSHMTFAVRTEGHPLAVAPSMRSAVHAVDPALPADSIVSMETVMSAATAEPRFNARLLSVFAILALGLAVVGTYGVLAHSVAQRTHEIGVRMALGAHARSVQWMVIRRTLALSTAGILLGTGGALLSTRLMHTLLFEIAPTDARTFAAVAAVILLAALAAGYLPARRATRIDPLQALRHE